MASIDRTFERINPYRMDRAPQLLFPVMPPMVARLAVDTSTGKNKP
jgi:hypothetical protein